MSATEDKPVKNPTEPSPVGKETSQNTCLNMSWAHIRSLPSADIQQMITILPSNTQEQKHIQATLSRIHREVTEQERINSIVAKFLQDMQDVEDNQLVLGFIAAPNCTNVIGRLSAAAAKTCTWCARIRWQRPQMCHSCITAFLDNQLVPIHSCADGTSYCRDMPCKCKKF